MADPIEGGCLCGAIRYKIVFPAGSEYPPQPHTCQCTDCRKQSGSLIVHFITVPLSNIEWTSLNKPSQFSASTGKSRGFCATCGSCLTWYEAAVPHELEIMSGTIDQDVLMGPRGKELTTVVNQAWCCRFIEGVTDVIKHGKKWEKGGDSRVLED